MIKSSIILVRQLFCLLLFWVLTCCSTSGDDIAENDVLRFEGVSLPEAFWQDFDLLRGDRERIDFLLDYVANHHYQTPEICLAFSERAVESSVRNDFPVLRAKALYWTARIANDQDPENVNLRRALADTQIGIDILKDQPSPSVWLARLLNLRSAIHYSLYEESIGLRFNLRADSLIRLISNDGKDYALDLGDVYRVRGNIYLYTEDSISAAQREYQSALWEYRIGGDSVMVYQVYHNMAIMFEKDKRHSRADSLLRWVITNSSAIDDKRVLKVRLDYATLLSKRYKRTKDTKWLKRSNAILYEGLDADPEQHTEFYYQLAANYQNIAIKEVDLEKTWYDSAVVNYNATIQYAKIENNTAYLQKVEKQIAKVCPDIGPSQCNFLLKVSAEAGDDLRFATKLFYREAMEKREVFRTQQSARKRRNLLLASGLVVAGLFVLFTIYEYRSRIKSLRTQLNIRMQALRAQMNPHFISNSLNAIDSLVNQNENDAASEYLIDFSRLCRLILKNSREDHIPLSQELETLKYFLSMERLRMGDRLNYKFVIDPAIDTGSILIPPMLIQPFVENSIIHGIQNKQASGIIEIVVEAHQNQSCRVVVSDDGVGRVKAGELKDKSVLERPSFGISIARERIEALSRDKNSSIEYQDLTAEDGTSVGTKVVLIFPLRPLEK